MSSDVQMRGVSLETDLNSLIESIKHLNFIRDRPPTVYPNKWDQSLANPKQKDNLFHRRAIDKKNPFSKALNNWGARESKTFKNLLAAFEEDSMYWFVFWVNELSKDTLAVVTKPKEIIAVRWKYLTYIHTLLLEVIRADLTVELADTFIRRFDSARQALEVKLWRDDGNVELSLTQHCLDWSNKPELTNFIAFIVTRQLHPDMDQAVRLVEEYIPFTKEYQEATLPDLAIIGDANVERQAIKCKFGREVIHYVNGYMVFPEDREFVNRALVVFLKSVPICATSKKDTLIVDGVLVPVAPYYAILNVFPHIVNQIIFLTGNDNDVLIAWSDNVLRQTNEPVIDNHIDDIVSQLLPIGFVSKAKMGVSQSREYGASIAGIPLPSTDNHQCIFFLAMHLIRHHITKENVDELKINRLVYIFVCVMICLDNKFARETANPSQQTEMDIETLKIGSIQMIQYLCSEEFQAMLGRERDDATTLRIFINWFVYAPEVLSAHWSKAYPYETSMIGTFIAELKNINLGMHLRRYDVNSVKLKEAGTPLLLVQQRLSKPGLGQLTGNQVHDDVMGRISEYLFGDSTARSVKAISLYEDPTDETVKVKSPTGPYFEDEYVKGDRATLQSGVRYVREAVNAMSRMRINAERTQEELNAAMDRVHLQPLTIKPKHMRDPSEDEDITRDEYTEPESKVQRVEDGDGEDESKEDDMEDV